MNWSAAYIFVCVILAIIASVENCGPVEQDSAPCDPFPDKIN